VETVANDSEEIDKELAKFTLHTLTNNARKASLFWIINPTVREFPNANNNVAQTNVFEGILVKPVLNCKTHESNN
jgi:hypothetical protein